MPRARDRLAETAAIQTWIHQVHDEQTVAVQRLRDDLRARMGAVLAGRQAGLIAQHETLDFCVAVARLYEGAAARINHTFGEALTAVPGHPRHTEVATAWADACAIHFVLNVTAPLERQVSLLRGTVDTFRDIDVRFPLRRAGAHAPRPGEAGAT